MGIKFIGDMPQNVMQWCGKCVWRENSFYFDVIILSACFVCNIVGILSSLHGSNAWKGRWRGNLV